MHDAQPVLTGLLLGGLGLLLLGLDWLSAAPSVRAQRLDAIAQREAARLGPPRAAQAQARWLLQHRVARLQGLGLLLGMSALVGLGEGMARRHRDSLAGLRLRNWTLGVVGLAVTPGLAGALLLLPWPWSLAFVAGGSALWSAGTVFLMSSGRPHVP